MKIIAMYLPQFYRTHENDRWWGEGFTDWVTVKNATKIVEEQRQPRKPYKDNYYNLLDKKTMEWQAELMHDYGVDGICMYHYWFKDGKQILERPAENILKWKDIDLPYCFSWANETWARSWSNVKVKNVWSDLYEEPQGKKSGKGILLEQSYGDEEEWRSHFEYMLPFFEDERYIRKNDKPVFMIYHAGQIHCLGRMLECWRRWAIEAGLPGIYVIGRGGDYYTEQYLDGLFIQEPQGAIGRMTIRHGMPQNGLRIFDYDEMWTSILSQDLNKSVPVYYGGFCDYDDSPRRGEEGQIVMHASPDKFQHYLAKLMAKNEVLGNSFTFINAWNEWGESMYLEPDEDRQYSYLESIRQARVEYKKYQDEFKNIRELDESELKRIQIQNDRRYRYMKIFDKWLLLVEKNSGFLAKWLNENSMTRIAIYGMGMLGRHVYHQLIGSNIQVFYAIDRDATKELAGLKIMHPEEKHPPADVVIVTAFYDYEKIHEALQREGLESISLEKLIMNIL